MTDRDRNPRRGGGPDRPRRSPRGTGSAGRPDEPVLPDDVAASDLDTEVRRDLLTLDKTNAENVARHLVMVTRLLEDDPALALEHARAARRRAGRVGMVRETMGIAAYNAGEWQEALSELRAARRITGNTALLPLIADAERGLGRPARAVEIARSEEGRALTGDEATEMRIVESGARIDLDEPDRAVVTLQSEDLTPGRTGIAAARLYYAYASALQAAGRTADAVTWFMNAASADIDDMTDAEDRLMGLTSDEDAVDEDVVDEAVVDEAVVDEAVVDETTVAESGSEESGSEEPVTPGLADVAEPARVEDTPVPDSVVPDTDAEATTDTSPEVVPTPVPDIDTEVTGDTSPEAVPTPVPDIDTEVSADTAPAVVPTPVPDMDAEAIPGTPSAAVDAPVSAQATAPDTSQSSATVLGKRYDALLLDLDGTVFAGHRALPGAQESLESIGTPQYFVTNNASRRPSAVVEHLVELGFSATAEQVVTSAQSAARLLAEHLEPGSRALVIGTDGLAQEVREVGIGVTRSADDRPAAVIQGHSPETGWAQLSEAALAINAGALWIATNTDATLPSERGNLVGNGSMVAAVANATGQQPLVAGKPAAPLMADAISRSKATKPLVVGDRLDTDIEGAHSVGIDSALVLTGVSSAADLLVAPPEQRPTFVIKSLTGLFTDAEVVRVGVHDGWQIDVTGDVATVSRTGSADDDSLVPALAHVVWQAIDEDRLDPTELSVTSVDGAVQALLESVGVTRVR
ncbi:HAD-IIA family hydrolase [Gordonia sp. NPDC003424]